MPFFFPTLPSSHFLGGEQKDHVVKSMNDLMSRYSPAVPKHRYRVRFVPVLSPDTPEQEREELAKVDTRSG